MVGSWGFGSPHSVPKAYLGGLRPWLTDFSLCGLALELLWKTTTPFGNEPKFRDCLPFGSARDLGL